MRPSIRDEGMKLPPLSSACAGLENHPTRLSEVPPVRAQVALTLMPEKLLAVELSVMLARLAVATSVLRVMLVFRVAFNCTVTGPLDVSPTWACAVLAPARATAVAPTRARFTRAYMLYSNARGSGQPADKRLPGVHFRVGTQVQDMCQ